MTALALSPTGVQMPSLSKVIDEWFGNEFRGNGRLKMPATNLIEFDDHFLMELSVPGHQKDDFKIEIDQNLLTISSEKSESRNDEEHNYRLREFSSFSFLRSFDLTDTIDSEKISASYDNGILKVNLPKKEGAKKLPPRSVEIA